MSIGNGKTVKSNSDHPFARKDPKPTRARLVSLLDPLGRKRYSEVEWFLATINGATSGLYYYSSGGWGWAVRYLLGAKNTLCTLHLLPNNFEATVMLGKERDNISCASFSTDLKRRISRGKVQAGLTCVRLPIKNDHDYASFQTLINLRAEALRLKKAPKAKSRAAGRESARVTARRKRAVRCGHQHRRGQDRAGRGHRADAAKNAVGCRRLQAHGERR